MGCWSRNSHPHIPMLYAHTLSGAVQKETLHMAILQIFRQETQLERRQPSQFHRPPHRSANVHRVLLLQSVGHHGRLVQFHLLGQSRDCDEHIQPYLYGSDGIASGTTIRVSHQLGQQHYTDMRKAGIASMHLSICYNLICTADADIQTPDTTGLHLRRQRDRAIGHPADIRRPLPDSRRTAIGNAGSPARNVGRASAHGDSHHRLCLHQSAHQLPTGRESPLGHLWHLDGIHHRTVRCGRHGHHQIPDKDQTDNKRAAAN